MDNAERQLESDFVDAYLDVNSLHPEELVEIDRRLLNQIGDENLKIMMNEEQKRAEEKARIDEDALDQLAASIPQNKVQGTPKQPTVQLRYVTIVKDGTGNTGHLEGAIEAPVEIVANEIPHTQFIREEGESMQEFSDRLDEEKRLLAKCEECKHERRSHVGHGGSCGNCDCSKFAKRVFAPKPHLTDRPFVQSLELRDLQRKLHQEEATNPKAKRQR